jgi:hypothetical protein
MMTATEEEGEGVCCGGGDSTSNSTDHNSTLTHVTEVSFFRWQVWKKGERIVSNVLKVHKIEILFGLDFEICNISLLVMSKY